jgi:hypothetical protein
MYRGLYVHKLLTGGRDGLVRVSALGNRTVIGPPARRSTSTALLNSVPCSLDIESGCMNSTASKWSMAALNRTHWRSFSRNFPASSA